MLFDPKYDDRHYRVPGEPLRMPPTLPRGLKSTLRVVAMMLAIIIVVTAIVTFRTWMWMPPGVH
jgi:hypothetical protein